MSALLVFSLVLTQLPLADREPSGRARVELVGVQTAHGVTQGALLCSGGVGGCGSSTLLVMAATGSGFGLIAGLLSWDGVSGATALAINSGSLWGLYTLGVASGAAGVPWNDARWFFSVGGIAGSLVGFSIDRLLQPTEGQLSLANSGGMWTALFGLLLLAGLPAPLPGWSAWATLAGTAAGYVSMGVLSRHLSLSRGQVLRIDGGGILGLMMGAVLGLAALDIDGTLRARLAMTGALVGLGTMAFVVSLPADDDDGPAISAAPWVAGPGAVGVRLGGVF